MPSLPAEMASEFNVVARAFRLAAVGETPVKGALATAIRLLTGRSLPLVFLLVFGSLVAAVARR